MPRIRGKVGEALNEAREWIEASEHDVTELESMLAKARMQLEMHQTVYHILEKTLTRQPRKSSKSNNGMARAVNNSLKAASKSTKKAGKKRGAAVEPIIAGTLYGVMAKESDDDPNACCQKTFPGGFVCAEPADANVHHLRGVTGYHEFEASGVGSTMIDDVAGEKC